MNSKAIDRRLFHTGMPPGMIGNDCREPEAHGGSDTFRAGDVEAATDSSRKTARSGKPKSCSLAAWLGGEERFTGARKNIRWHPAARIGDGNACI